jgi:glucosamine-6-phosphate deaminase
MTVTKEFKKDNLTVKIYESRDQMGRSVAKDGAEKIKQLISSKEAINIMFATGRSQDDFLKYIVKEKDIEWKKVNAFHMDEFIGVGSGYPQIFGLDLKKRLFDKLNFKEVFYINGNAEDVKTETNRYADLLIKHTLDIVFLGIGENGHIAFNDPHIADFNDPEILKVVDMDEICRNQQVRDRYFKSLNEVPFSAITVTIPTIFNTGSAFITVPGISKADIIKKVMKCPIDEKVPAAIMRTHNNAILYLDSDSASLINI